MQWLRRASLGGKPKPRASLEETAQQNAVLTPARSAEARLPDMTPWDSSSSATKAPSAPR